MGSLSRFSKVGFVENYGLRSSIDEINEFSERVVYNNRLWATRSEDSCGIQSGFSWKIQKLILARSYYYSFLCTIYFPSKITKAFNKKMKSDKGRWNKGKKGAFFPCLWGYLVLFTIYIRIFKKKLVYLHKLSIQNFLLIKFFSKNFKIFY